MDGRPTAVSGFRNVEVAATSVVESPMDRVKPDSDKLSHQDGLFRPHGLTILIHKFDVFVSSGSPSLDTCFKGIAPHDRVTLFGNMVREPASRAIAPSTG